MCGALCCLTLETIGTCKEHGSAPEARGHGSHHGASQRAGLRAPVNDWSLVRKSERGGGLFPRSREVFVGGAIFGLWSGKTRKRRSASQTIAHVSVFTLSARAKTYLECTHEELSKTCLVIFWRATGHVQDAITDGARSAVRRPVHGHSGHSGQLLMVDAQHSLLGPCRPPCPSCPHGWLVSRARSA